MPDDPLSSKEAMAAFIQRARASGKSDDEIRAFVQRKRQAAEYQIENLPSTPGPPQAPPAAAPPRVSLFRTVAPGKVVYGEPLPSEEQMKQDALNALKTGAGVGLTIAGTELGGGLIPTAFVKARPLAGMALKAITRGLGAGAGGEASAVLQGEKPSLRRGLETAGNVALTEGVVRTPAYLAGRAGGVEPAAAALAQDNPKLLKRVSPKDYASAVEDIARTPTPQTAEHFGYNMLLRARGEVDGRPYVQAIRSTLRTNAAEGTVVGVERKAAILASKLEGALGPGGKISAEALDDWLRTNVSEPAARVYEKGAGTAWQERLAGIRDDLVPKLYDDVGGGASELQRAASVKIGKVNAAKNMLPAATEGRMNLQSPSYLRQVLKDTDLGYQVRTRLSGLDEVAGTNHLARVEELAMRSSWTAAEKAEVEDILANVPAIGYERVGLVRASARKAGRGLTRIVRPAGRVAAVGSTIRGVSQ